MSLSKELLPVAVIVFILFGLNWLWSISLTPKLVGLFGNNVIGLALDAILKTSVSLALGATALYKMKVSQSVNDLIDKVLKILRLRS